MKGKFFDIFVRNLFFARIFKIDGFCIFIFCFERLLNKEVGFSF